LKERINLVAVLETTVPYCVALASGEVLMHTDVQSLGGFRQRLTIATKEVADKLTLLHPRYYLFFVANYTLDVTAQQWKLTG